MYTFYANYALAGNMGTWHSQKDSNMGMDGKLIYLS